MHSVEAVTGFGDLAVSDADNALAPGVQIRAITRDVYSENARQLSEKVEVVTGT